MKIYIFFKVNNFSCLILYRQRYISFTAHTENVNKQEMYSSIQYACVGELCLELQQQNSQNKNNI